jgi:hypothetical protein
MIHTLGGVADYNTPGSDSEAASKLLDERFAGRSGDQVHVGERAGCTPGTRSTPRSVQGAHT